MKKMLWFIAAYMIGFCYNALVITFWHLPPEIERDAWILTKVLLSDEYLPILMQGGVITLILFIFFYKIPDLVSKIRRWKGGLVKNVQSKKGI